MEAEVKQITIIGLPESGKTSFLAALQHYVHSDLDSKQIQQYKYSPNSEYLNNIHNKWVNCEQQSRTIQEQSGSHDILMFLEVSRTKQRFVLSVPDIAGEIFVEQWQSRYWNRAYKDRVSNTTGLILFIHPEKIKAHAVLTDVFPVIDLIEGESELKPWEIGDTPTQVVLVDLLQIHIDHIKKMPVPVAIIISAWDTVKAEIPELTPARWLEESLPYLYQFLCSNTDELIHEVYGISALGGNILCQDVSKKLIELEEPSERVIVQINDSVHNDITEPIIWISDKWS